MHRLLRRADAADRRIVCLSAILPSGDELDDLAAWIRSDEPGEPVRSDWRPTRQRFGALTWRGKDALLRLDLDDDGPFLDKFVVEKPARGKEKNPYPRRNSHLALFAAWEFASQGKKRLLDIAATPPAGLYRIVTDEGDGQTWLATLDYHWFAAFKKAAVDPKPSLFSGRLPGNTRLVAALRVGRGKLLWPKLMERLSGLILWLTDPLCMILQKGCTFHGFRHAGATGMPFRSPPVKRDSGPVFR